jgi:beta-glucosidase
MFGKIRFAPAGAVLLLAVASQCSFSQLFGAPKKVTGAWMDKKLTPDQRADLVLKEMTLDEKIQLVHGTGVQGFGKVDPAAVRSNGGGGFVPGIERLGLPDLNMDDSSLGAGGGARKGRYSTALPSFIALASSWNTSLAREYGSLVGRELADEGYNISLGGGVNITREARNGRNFEYLGEDPILAGNLGSQWIQGVQSQGIIADIKHYAVNDQETGRYFVNAIVDKRALRETDLLAFEIGVKQGKPGMVMCSYNLINGDWGCENDYTLNQVLKNEWGFQGWVVSDWFATHSTKKAALAGLDMEQPLSRYFGDALKKAVEAGEIPMHRLDDMVRRILRTEFASGIIDDPQSTQAPNVFHGFKVAQHVAEESMVLLKNEKGQLPLNASTVKSIAVIGGHADAGVLTGGGSAQVDPPGGNAVPDPKAKGNPLAVFSQTVYDPSVPVDEIRGMAPTASVTFDPGTNSDAAAKVAKKADVAIVFVTQHTTEGIDLDTLELPDNQNALVQKIAAANPHTIVIIESGGSILMPWATNVSAIVEVWYPGIQGSKALANLLFGKVNFSGKSAITFPASDADLPHASVAMVGGKKPNPIDGLLNPRPPFPAKYDEGLKVGYKWFDAENKKPLFPFGFGLSYTTFSYSALKATGGNTLEVAFSVRNTGKREGEEIAQVYLTLPASAGEPPKRLVGWEKIFLKPGESKVVALKIDPLYLSIFDTEKDKWTIVSGEYKVMIGPSSATLPLSATVKLQGSCSK